MSRRSRASQTTRVRFSLLNGTSIASGGPTSGTIALAPNLSTQLGNLAKAFQFYRFTRVDIELAPPDYPESSLNDTGNAMAAIGFLSEETATTSTTITVAQVLELIKSRLVKPCQNNATVSSTGYTSPVMLRLSRKDLLETPVKWYKTQSASSEQLEVQQGTIVCAVNVSPTSAMQFYYHVRGEIEFSHPIDATAIV
jgi:hypothetical protein